MKLIRKKDGFYKYLLHFWGIMEHKIDKPLAKLVEKKRVGEMACIYK